MLKRLRIFIRRYLLAIVILFLPALLQCAFILLIPSKTNLVNLFGGTQTEKSGIYNLQTSNYGNFHLPYYLNGSYSIIPFKTLLYSFYTPFNRPGIELLELSSQNINEYVLEKRKTDLKYLVQDFFIGMKFNVTGIDKIYATLYFSSLALHSSAIAVNELSNLLLAYHSRSIRKTISTLNSPLASNDSLYTGNDFLEYLACIDVLPVSLLNMITSIIIAFIISALVISIAREKNSGAKSLQYLSRTHFVTYWISNYLFDICLCLFNLTSILAILKLIDMTRNDPSNETYPIATNDTLAYVFVLFLVSSLNWCSFAYIFSFFFRNDLIGFIFTFLVLGVATFLDMVWALIQLFVSLERESDQNKFLSNLMKVLRYVCLLFFPNVTVKRGLYNLKIRQNTYCINNLNNILKSN